MPTLQCRPARPPGPRLFLCRFVCNGLCRFVFRPPWFRHQSIPTRPVLVCFYAVSCVTACAVSCVTTRVVSCVTATTGSSSFHDSPRAACVGRRKSPPLVKKVGYLDTEVVVGGTLLLFSRGRTVLFFPRSFPCAVLFVKCFENPVFEDEFSGEVSSAFHFCYFSPRQVFWVCCQSMQCATFCVEKLVLVTFRPTGNMFRNLRIRR